MATRFLTEAFDGGVVDTRNPLYLRPGELAAAENCYYSAQEKLLTKVPVVATALASAYSCKGLKHVFFTDAEHLITHGVGGYYKSTITSSTGALGAITPLNTMSVTTIPDTFSAIQQNNKYVLLDGLNTPQVLRSDLTLRRLGLQPVIKKVLAATATAGASTWPGRVVGYFDYWYTEVAEYGGSPEDIIVESAYEATVSTDAAGSPSTAIGNAITTNGRSIKIDVATVNVTTLSTLVNVDLPLVPRNATTTHYYVYRSLNKDFEVEPSFPVGEKIARVAIPTSATDPVVVDGRIRVIDGAVTSSGPFYTATYVTSVANEGTSWTNPANAAADNSTEYSDGTYARFTVPTATFSTYSSNQLVVSSMSATGIYDPVAQIKVTFRARLQGGFTGAGSGVAANIRISGNAGTSYSAAQAISVTATAFADYATPWTNWGNPYLSTTDIANANFRVRIDFSGYKPTVVAGTGYIDVDGIKVEIKHNGTVPVPIGAYPGIVLQIGQDKFVSSKGGEPPVGSVGCMYKGSLVTNDVSNKNMVRWSMPGEIDAFPSLYYFPVQSPSGSSEITYLGVVNNICIIGTKSSIARINYLPSENDSNFMRDSIYDFITTDVGIVNSTAAVTYRNTDGREVLAVVTAEGVMVTDGFSIHKVDSDYDFAALVTLFNTNSNSIYSPARVSLVNETYSKNLFLVHNYNNDTSIKAMNWGQNHVKDGGQFKMGGDWSLGGVYVAVVSSKTLTGRPVVYLLDYTGAIKKIDPTSSSKKNGQFIMTTRLLGVNEQPSEFDLAQLYLYGAANSLTNVNAAITTYRTGKATQVITTSTAATAYTMDKINCGISGELMSIQFIGPSSTAATALGHMVLEYDDQLQTEVT